MVGKILGTIFLLVIITVMAGYGTLYYFFNLTQADNAVNTSFRPVVLKYPVLKKIFRLHQIGDARYDFSTADNFDRIGISVIAAGNESLDPATIDLVIREINRVVAKPGGIAVSETIPLRISGSVADETLLELAASYRPAFTPGTRTLPLNIFLLSSYRDHPTYAGMVVDANSIFLFMDAIRDLSKTTRTTQKAEMSTILHEFGHLLGAEHTEDSDCIMSAVVEDTSYGVLPAAISESYCDSDLSVINTAVNKN